MVLNALKLRAHRVGSLPPPLIQGRGLFKKEDVGSRMKTGLPPARFTLFSNSSVPSLAPARSPQLGQERSQPKRRSKYKKFSIFLEILGCPNRPDGTSHAQWRSLGKGGGEGAGPRPSLAPTALCSSSQYVIIAGRALQLHGFDPAPPLQPSHCSTLGTRPRAHNVFAYVGISTNICTQECEPN